MKNAVIGRTGQWIKVLIGFVALLVGSIAPLFESSGISVTNGTILAIAGYGLTVLTVRCPDCGERWFWKALMDASLYKPLFTQPSCPACGKDFAADD